MMKRIEKILNWFHSVNQRQWFICSIITSTVGLWYQLVLTYLGPQLKLVAINTTGQRELTFGGWALTIVTATWSIMSFASQRYAEQSNFKSSSAIESKEKLTTPLRTAYSALCKLKLSSLLKEIREEIQNNQYTMQNIPETPCKQLEEISTQIANALSSVLTVKNHNMKPEDFYVAIYYNFPREGDRWSLAHKHDVIKGLSTSDLIKSETSFTTLLNNSQSSILFFNKKQDGYLKKQYLPDNDDKYNAKTKELLGSILCYKKTFKAENMDLIQCVICVSTYSKYMLKDPTQEMEDNMLKYMEDVLFQEFSLRIGIELCLDYIIGLSKNNNSNSKTQQ